MALTIDMGSANPGQIALVGTLDGVDFAALRAKILSHLHAIGNVCSTHSETPVPVRGAGGETSFHIATAKDEYGNPISPGWEAAHCENRYHSHGAGTLAVSATYATTALSPTNNDQILIAYANGDLTCDLIDGYAPQVVYDRYDGHYHYVAGSVASTTLPILNAFGYSGKKYFHMATDSAGSNADWVNISSSTGAHAHANYNLALLAYTAPAGAGSDDAGEPKFAAAFATGNITLRGDVNNIGIAQFYANYIAHNAHAWTGRTAVHPASGDSLAALYNGSFYWAECGSPGNWALVYAVGVSHSHTGPPLTVAVPT